MAGRVPSRSKLPRISRHLTLAVRLPLLRRGSRGYDLYKPTFFPIMHGSHLYDIRTEEKIFAWEKATASYLNLDDEALNRCIQAGNKYFCNEAKVVMQGSPQTCLAAVWLQEWSGIKLMCHLWLRPAISSARKINSTHTWSRRPRTRRSGCSAQRVQSWLGKSEDNGGWQ
jgi:hypothetical protein